jgi:hypothetical protein
MRDLGESLRRASQIGNSHRAARIRRLRLDEVNCTVQPFLYGSIDLRIAAIFQPATQTGEMSGIGFGGVTVSLHVLHAVRIERQVTQDSVCRVGISTRTDFIPQRLASLTSPYVRSAAIWTRI